MKEFNVKAKEAEDLNKVVFMKDVVLVFLFFTSIGFALYAYDCKCSVEAVDAKIERFKADAKEELAFVIAERDVFVRENQWRGRLTQVDVKEVAYLNEEIELLECYNQAVNLLEVNLSYP
jgi:hypothetical protein